MTRCRSVALTIFPLAFARAAPIEPAKQVAVLPAAAGAFLNPSVTAALLAGLAAAAHAFDAARPDTRDPEEWARSLGMTARNVAAKAAATAGASAAVAEAVAQEAFAVSLLGAFYQIDARDDLELTSLRIWNWIQKQMGFGDANDLQGQIITLKERRAEMRDAEGLTEKQREWAVAELTRMIDNLEEGTDQAKRRERLKDAFKDSSGIPKKEPEPPSSGGGGDQASATTGVVGGTLGGIVGFALGFALVLTRMKHRRPAASPMEGTSAKRSALDTAPFSN